MRLNLKLAIAHSSKNQNKAMIDGKIRTCPEGFSYWFETKTVEDIISAIQALSEYNKMTATFCGYDSSVFLKDVQGAFRQVGKFKAAASYSTVYETAVQTSCDIRPYFQRSSGSNQI